MASTDVQHNTRHGGTTERGMSNGKLLYSYSMLEVGQRPIPTVGAWIVSVLARHSTGSYCRRYLIKQNTVHGVGWRTERGTDVLYYSSSILHSKLRWGPRGQMGSQSTRVFGWCCPAAGASKSLEFGVCADKERDKWSATAIPVKRVTKPGGICLNLHLSRDSVVRQQYSSVVDRASAPTHHARASVVVVSSFLGCPSLAAASTAILYASHYPPSHTVNRVRPSVRRPAVVVINFSAIPQSPAAGTRTETVWLSPRYSRAYSVFRDPLVLVLVSPALNLT